jgi:hypothetical protein
VLTVVKFTHHVGVEQVATILVFNFQQAAAATAVAKGFPFFPAQFIEGLCFPEAGF